MADAKTRPGGDPAAFIAGIGDERRRAEAAALDAMFRRVTGREPVLWGGTMLGYGRYAYTYASGHSGEAFATGFSPRKAELSLYVLPSEEDAGPLLARLGRHRAGKACLSVRRLADVDMGVLEELVRLGLRDLGSRWPVTD